MHPTGENISKVATERVLSGAKPTEEHFYKKQVLLSPKQTVQTMQKAL